MRTKVDPGDLIARARPGHRSGDRFAIAAYLGRSDRFDTALVTFAERYADQNELDYAALAAAVKVGTVPAGANS